MAINKTCTFKVSITSRELQMSRLGLVSKFQRLVLVSSREANVSVSGGERLGLELLRLVPIPDIMAFKVNQ